VTVSVELARTGDAPDLALILAEHGLEADVRGGSCELVVVADDIVSVEHAVDAWTASRGLPFVPYLVGADRVIVAPPPS
jgi:hypothetical protein